MRLPRLQRDHDLQVVPQLLSELVLFSIPIYEVRKQNSTGVFRLIPDPNCFYISRFCGRLLAPVMFEIKHEVV